jgi:fluoride exporter
VRYFILQITTGVRNPIAISFGAVAGALSRYYLTLWFAQRYEGFPYGTFVINMTGCLGMGFFFTLASERIPAIPPEVRLLVAVGFLGAYTTFSTYGIDTVNLLRHGSLWKASFYWAGSAVLGVICVQLGVILASIHKS